MKLELVTKPEKRNKTVSKTFGNNVMTENFEVIDVFPTYGQFGAIRKLDSRRIACKSYIFIN